MIRSRAAALAALALLSLAPGARADAPTWKAITLSIVQSRDDRWSLGLEVHHDTRDAHYGRMRLAPFPENNIYGGKALASELEAIDAAVAKAPFPAAVKEPSNPNTPDDPSAPPTLILDVMRPDGNVSQVVAPFDANHGNEWRPLVDALKKLARLEHVAVAIEGKVKIEKPQPAGFQPSPPHTDMVLIETAPGTFVEVVNEPFRAKLHAEPGKHVKVSAVLYDDLPIHPKRALVVSIIDDAPHPKAPATKGIAAVVPK